jgi:hypothetical protein
LRQPENPLFMDIPTFMDHDLHGFSWMLIRSQRENS